MYLASILVAEYWRLAGAGCKARVFLIVRYVTVCGRQRGVIADQAPHSALLRAAGGWRPGGGVLISFVAPVHVVPSTLALHYTVVLFEGGWYDIMYFGTATHHAPDM